MRQTSQSSNSNHEKYNCSYTQKPICYLFLMIFPFRKLFLPSFLTMKIRYEKQFIVLSVLLHYNANTIHFFFFLGSPTTHEIHFPPHLTATFLSDGRVMVQTKRSGSPPRSPLQPPFFFVHNPQTRGKSVHIFPHKVLLSSINWSLWGSSFRQKKPHMSRSLKILRGKSPFIAGCSLMKFD